MSAPKQHLSGTIPQLDALIRDFGEASVVAVIETMRQRRAAELAAQKARRS